MNKDVDFLLFDAIRHVGRAMRAGKPPGVMSSDPCRSDGCSSNPAFKREMVLPILSDSEDGRLRQNLLTEELKVSPSTLSMMISRLEEDGYVTRCNDPDDKRAVVIALTPQGAVRAAEIKAKGKEAFAQLFRRLTEDEKLTLIALLQKISQSDGEDEA